MTIKTARVTVTTTRTPLYIQDADMTGGSSLEAYVISGGTIYVGGPNVTVANGRPVPVGGSYGLDLRSGEELFAICDTGVTAAVALLGSGV